MREAIKAILFTVAVMLWGASLLFVGLRFQANHAPHIADVSVYQFQRSPGEGLRAYAYFYPTAEHGEFDVILSGSFNCRWQVVDLDLEKWNGANWIKTESPAAMGQNPEHETWRGRHFEGFIWNLDQSRQHRVRILFRPRKEISEAAKAFDLKNLPRIVNVSFAPGIYRELETSK